jgi:hypothetical protein
VPPPRGWPDVHHYRFKHHAIPNQLGLDHVSCSPSRVPGARLAAADAAVAVSAAT